MARDTDSRSRTAAPEQPGKIQSRILDFTHGLRVYDEVRLIRIKSREYSLLIMEDYFPAMGSVQGRVELITDGEQIKLELKKGFYLLRDNIFSLLIEEELSEERERTEQEPGETDDEQ